VIIGIAHLEGCTISSVLTSLVTDFNSTSDGRTRESSFSPKLHRNKNKGLITISPSPIPRAAPQPQTLNPHDSPVDPALHRPLRRAPAPDPRAVHLRQQIRPSENPNAGEGGYRLPVRALPSTLSATKSTTASAFSGVVRSAEEMPRQRSFRVGGGGRAPSPPADATAAAEARGRRKHQARALTGNTKTRACIAPCSRNGGGRGLAREGRDGSGGGGCRAESQGRTVLFCLAHAAVRVGLR
jgi:hypothetical protein